MKCLTCEKQFHYCSSCSSDPCFDEQFCSEECLISSKTYQEAKEILEDIPLPILEKLLNLPDIYIVVYLQEKISKNQEKIS